MNSSSRRVLAMRQVDIRMGSPEEKKNLQKYKLKNEICPMNSCYVDPEAHHLR